MRETIAHVLRWLAQRRHLISISAISSAMGIWAAINAYIHKRMDRKIMRAIYRRNGGSVTTYDIAKEIETSVGKIEARLFDLLDRGKVSRSTNNFEGKSYWCPPEQPRR
jgi:hypothetical protein